MIASSHSPEALARTIASLGSPGDDVELIVASGEPVAGRKRPNAVVVIGESNAGVGCLRRLGFDASRAAVVAFTEDSCILSGGWARAWIDAFQDLGVITATGPVAPAMGDRPIDWALFFCEYAAFLRQGSRPARLAGNNFAVRRSLAARLGPDEIHESEISTCPGERFVVVAGAVAQHVRNYSITEAIRDRLRFAYDYGVNRGRSLPRMIRLRGLVAGPPILLVQAVRMVRFVARGGAHSGVFLESLPMTICLLAAWSIGEWLGSIRAIAPLPAASRRPHERAGRPIAPAADRATSKSRHYRSARTSV